MVLPGHYNNIHTLSYDKTNMFITLNNFYICIKSLWDIKVVCLGVNPNYQYMHERETLGYVTVLSFPKYESLQGNG